MKAFAFVTVLLSFVSCMHSPVHSETSALLAASARLGLGSELQALHETPPGRADGVFVLMAIDGVRWQDVFAAHETELVPELQALGRRGVILGAPGFGEFLASGPNFVSLPGYMEMLAGTSQTRCTENVCTEQFRPTLADDFFAATGRIDKIGVFSSWPKIAVAAHADRRSAVVSTGRFDGRNHDVLRQWQATAEALELGRTEHGGHGSFRDDAVTAQLALAFLREARPNFLFLSLGETDERAHQGDYAGYRKALRFADRVVADIAAELEERQSEGAETLFMITTDHGRAHSFRPHGRSYPESARSFLFADGTLVRRALGRVSGSAALKDIAPTIRHAAGLRQHQDAGSGRVLLQLLPDGQSEQPRSLGSALVELAINRAR